MNGRLRIWVVSLGLAVIGFLASRSVPFLEIGSVGGVDCAQAAPHRDCVTVAVDHPGQYIWHDGYYAYQPGWYSWNPGYYAYQSGYWVHHDSYWVYHPGYWQHHGGYWSYDPGGCDDDGYCWDPSWTWNDGWDEWVDGWSEWIASWDEWVDGYWYWVDGWWSWNDGYDYWVSGYYTWQDPYTDYVQDCTINQCDGTCPSGATLICSGAGTQCGSGVSCYCSGAETGCQSSSDCSGPVACPYSQQAGASWSCQSGQCVTVGCGEGGNPPPATPGPTPIGLPTATPVVTPTPTRGPTTTTLSSSPNPSVYGQSVTFTAQVSASGGTPTGNVTFYDGTTNLGTGALSGGSANLSTNGLAVGSHAITAVYGGDGNFNASTSPVVTQVVNKASTTTTISSALPSPALLGQTVTLVFQVLPVAPGAGTPTGTVTVSDGAGATCSASVATGSCGIAFTLAGAHSMTATYAGDGNFLASVSGPAVVQIVNPTICTFTVRPYLLYLGTHVSPSQPTQHIAGAICNALPLGGQTVTITVQRPSGGSSVYNVTTDGGGNYTLDASGVGDSDFGTTELGIWNASARATLNGATVSAGPAQWDVAWFLIHGTK